MHFGIGLVAAFTNRIFVSGTHATHLTLWATIPFPFRIDGLAQWRITCAAFQGLTNWQHLHVQSVRALFAAITNENKRISS